MKQLILFIVSKVYNDTILEFIYCIVERSYSKDNAKIVSSEVYKQKNIGYVDTRLPMFFNKILLKLEQDITYYKPDIWICESLYSNHKLKEILPSNLLKVSYLSLNNLQPLYGIERDVELFDLSIDLFGETDDKISRSYYTTIEAELLDLINVVVFIMFELDNGRKYVPVDL